MNGNQINLQLSNCLKGALRANSVGTKFIELFFIRAMLDDIAASRLEITDPSCFQAVMALQSAISSERVHPALIYSFYREIEKTFNLESGALSAGYPNFDFLLSEVGQRGFSEALRFIDVPSLREERMYVLQCLIEQYAESSFSKAEVTTGTVLSRLAAAILKPSPETVYLDAFCGVGSSSITVPEVAKYYGYDKNECNVCISTIAMILSGRSNFSIERADTLEVIDSRKYDRIFNDGPFGIKVEPYVAKETLETIIHDTNIRDLLSLATIKAAASLNEGGMSVNVLPNGLLFGATSGNIEFRHLMVKEGLSAIIELPAGSLPVTTIQVSLAVIQKGYTGDVQFISTDAFAVPNPKRRGFRMLSSAGIEECLDILENKKTIPGVSKLIRREELLNTDGLNLSVSKHLYEKKTINHRDISEIDNDIKKVQEEIFNLFR